MLEDYAYLIDGLLTLHTATGEAQWLSDAQALADGMLERFEDPRRGGFFLSPVDGSMFARPKLASDDVMPSANAVAARALGQLATRTGSERYRRAADRTLVAFGGSVEQAPASFATLIVAQNTARDSTPKGGASPASRSAAGGSAFHLPRSEDHVRVEAEPRAEPGDLVIVHLSIDSSWHVNANPASRPFLVPTVLEFSKGAEQVAIDYPPGDTFQPEFAPEPLSVYQGEVRIVARFAARAGTPEHATLRYQACDLKQCLPPGATTIELSAASRVSGRP